MLTLCRLLQLWFLTKGKSKPINVGQYFSFANQKCEDISEQVISGEAVDGCLSNLSWSAIIFGSYRYCGKPDKKERSGKVVETLKWLYIKCLYINLTNISKIWNGVDVLFCIDDFPLICYTPGSHVVKLLRFHNPKAKIRELTAYSESRRNHFLYWIALFWSRFGKIDQSRGEVILTNVGDEHFLRAYRRIHPNKTIVLRFHDIYEEVFGNADYSDVRSLLENLKSAHIVDSIEHYSQKEANALNIPFVCNKVRRDLPEIVSCDNKYLWMFIGHASKNEDRTDSFKTVKNFLLERYPDQSYFELIPGQNGKAISYEKYLEIVGQSKVIVDLYRHHSEEGWSYRIPEALLLQKKIITNRSNVIDSEVYHPSRFFIIGYDDISRLTEFIESPIIHLYEKILEKYRT